MSDPERWFDAIYQKHELLSDADMKDLCEAVSQLLIEEANVQPVSSPVTVCGDIHGQFWDLLHIFELAGEPAKRTNYIFMGDFVDRGHHSLECFTLLMAIKARYPDSITLLRGNHESRTITQVYGFYDECMKKYGNASVWNACCDVFDLLNIAALVDQSILCVHGGLSPEIPTIDHMRRLDRNAEIPTSGPLCDLMWSDPDDVEGWSVSPRGAGYLFGSRITNEFNHINDVKLIARAHQLMQEGYHYTFPAKNLVTVWSAPNYCYRCGNLASVMRINGEDTDDDASRFLVYTAGPTAIEYTVACTATGERSKQT